MAYERFQVVRVPFPFTDRETSKNRPALVLSDRERFNDRAGHSVVAMVTSAEHAPWPLDVRVGDLASAGLPRASMVRFKLFTLDRRLIRGVLGKLSTDDEVAVRRALLVLLPASPSRAPAEETEPTDSAAS